MTTQQYVPRRRVRSEDDLLGGLGARVFGAAVEPEADDDEPSEPSWLARLERRVRSTRWAWWLRRYGSVYPRLARLDDAGMLQNAGVAWLVYVAAGVILTAVAGPWSFLVVVPFGVALVAATGVGAWWWIGYRRSDKQLRHQMLSREGFARGREAKAHVGAVAWTQDAPTVRPLGTAVIRTVGRAEAASLQAHGLLDPAHVQDALSTTRRPTVAAATASTAGSVR